MNGLEIREKAAALRRAGLSDAARHLRRWARLWGVPMPPEADRLVELPALEGFDAADLDALGVPWRRADGANLISVPAPRGRGGAAG